MVDRPSRFPCFAILRMLLPPEGVTTNGAQSVRYAFVVPALAGICGWTAFEMGVVGLVYDGVCCSSVCMMLAGGGVC